MHMSFVFPEEVTFDDCVYQYTIQLVSRVEVVFNDYKQEGVIPTLDACLKKAKVEFNDFCWAEMYLKKQKEGVM